MKRAIYQAALSLGLPIPAPMGITIREREIAHILLLARRIDASVSKADVWKFLINSGYSIEPERKIEPKRIQPIKVENIVSETVSDVLTRHGLPQSHRVREYLPFYPVIYAESLALLIKKLSRPGYREYIPAAPTLIKKELERRRYVPTRPRTLKFWGKRVLPGYRTSAFQSPKGVATKKVLPREKLVPKFRVI